MLLRLFETPSLGTRRNSSGFPVPFGTSALRFAGDAEKPLEAHRIIRSLRLDEKRGLSVEAFRKPGTRAEGSRDLGAML